MANPNGHQGQHTVVNGQKTHVHSTHTLPLTYGTGQNQGNTFISVFLPVENLAETCYSEIHGFAVIKGIIRVPNYHKKINGFLKKNFFFKNYNKSLGYIETLIMEVNRAEP